MQHREVVVRKLNILLFMHQREHVIGKIQILLKAINQYKDIEQADKLLNIVEKELHTMLVILDEE